MLRFVSAENLCGTRQQHPSRLFAFVNTGPISKSVSPGSTKTGRHYTFCCGSGSASASSPIGPISAEIRHLNDDLSHNFDGNIPIILKTAGLLVVNKPWGVRMDGDFEVIVIPVSPLHLNS